MNIKSKEQLLFLHENVTNGGGEKMFRWLGQNLKKQGYNVNYLFMYDNPEIDISGLDADCIGLPITKSYFSRHLYYFTIGAYEMFKYLKRKDVKYIVSFGTNSLYLLGFYKYVLGFKILVSERADPRFKRFCWLRKWLFSKADAAVFQTPGARMFFTLNKDEKSYIIPNPVKLPSKLWSHKTALDNIVSVGRIDFSHKRQDILLKAFKIAHDKLPNIRLRIVGDGGDMPRLITMIEEMRLKESIDLVGQLKNVYPELLNSKVFVLTSDFEGIPNALLEAMSVGMPVISTDCSPGGARFLLGDSENGILVPREDYKQIADNIIELFGNTSFSDDLGNKARAAVERFSEDKIIEKWKEAVDRMLAE